MRLYVLDGGTIDVLNWSLFDPAVGPDVQKRLAAPVFLVAHPEGLLVWDAGLGDALLGEPEGVEIEGIARFVVAVGLADQFNALGYSPEQVRYLALSHFHPDHVGNVHLFASAELLVQEDEYAAAFGAEPSSFGYDASLYAVLRDSAVTRLSGDHDVFADGTVVLKRLPGHTPGSQSLLLRLAESGPILISGDLAHSVHNWEHDVVPAFNFDHDTTIRSMRAAREELAGNGAQLWIQHEYDQYAKLRRAPEFYA